MTDAVTAAPSVGEPAHHPLDRMGFYGFGQTLKPAVCEKCHNPKNSKNTCTDATTADDCGVMSLGHSLSALIFYITGVLTFRIEFQHIKRRNGNDHGNDLLLPTVG